VEIILDSPAMAFHFLKISTSPMQKCQMTTKSGHRHRQLPLLKWGHTRVNGWLNR